MKQPLATIDVAAVLTAVHQADCTITIDQWRTFWTYGNGAASIRCWPRRVRSAPTVGTWAALRHVAYRPRIHVRRGRGESLHVGHGTYWTTPATTWAMIERGWIDVDRATAAPTAIGWQMLTAYGFAAAMTAAQRAAWRARTTHRTGSAA
ncbi:hypothetical protein LO763_22215 [Glycomyces sp. A-F 0318]|uniref:hypothetical protein n=1 Tax=Glycomyces amatae TaxID=2881355 RepID=UPI001E371BB8|nr:hypothetical protein [Glycomyces amatae]MCD0446333.1 hypothetical protein [Glycomyces amatae]